MKKVVQETVVIEERRGMDVCASRDPAKAAGLVLDAQAEAASVVAAGVKGKEGSAETEEKRRKKGRRLAKP